MEGTNGTVVYHCFLGEGLGAGKGVKEEAGVTLRVRMCGKGPLHCACSQSTLLVPVTLVFCAACSHSKHWAIPTIQPQNLLPSLLPELLAAPRLHAPLAGVPSPISPSLDQQSAGTSSFWSDACPWVGWQSSICSAAKGLGDISSMEKGSSAELLFTGLLACLKCPGIKSKP